MLKATFEDGIPTCPKCRGQQFWVGFTEKVYHRLVASDRSDGWLESEPCESDGPDPIIGIVCYECDDDIEVTPEIEAFVRQIGG